jgi:hypothetical protein
VAEKVYNLNIRPSKIMDTCWIGNKFIDRILNNRLKLPEDEQKVWKKYLKMICRQSESSEKGFYLLFDWPLQPHESIEERLMRIKSEVKIDMLFGDNDWMQSEGAYRLQGAMENVKVHVVSEAGHQLIFDNPTRVSALIT